MVRCFIVSLRHAIMAEGASSGSRARQRLSRPWPFAHLRVEHQVNGFLGCDYNIALLFKLWKSHGRVDESRSTKPWRILCEVDAKLLAMLVQHWVFLVSFWAYPDRSLTKAAQTIQKHALHLASAFSSIQRLGRALLTVKRCLAAGCRMNRRKKHPNTYQLLLQATGP